MRVTTKGQVTIPVEEVEVVAGEDGALVRPALPKRRGTETVAGLRDTADGDLEADAALRLTRGGSG